MLPNILEHPTLSPCPCGGKAAYTAPAVSCVRCGRSVKVASDFVIKPESAQRQHVMWLGVFAWNEQQESR